MQESGRSVSDICREHGISQATFYNWKGKYSGMDLSQLKQMKEMEKELSQYKKIVAEQALQITVLKDVIEQLSLLADLHKTWGFWVMFHRLRKLQYMWNHKRVYRIYTAMRLNLRNKRKKRLPARVKAPLVCPIRPNITWSLDFMHDTLTNGRSVRPLNVIDDFNREALSIAVDTGLLAQRVIHRVERQA